MIEVMPGLSIRESDIAFDFIRSSGPGGQNVNKVATGVQLRFDLEATATLPDAVKARLRRIAGKRISAEGVLIIAAGRFRTQEQNREDALARLVALIRRAAEKPRPRKKTKPTAASQVRRIEGKRRRSAIKRLRRVERKDLE